MRKTTTLYLTLVLLSAGLSLAYGAPEDAPSLSGFCEKLMVYVPPLLVALLFYIGYRLIKYLFPKKRGNKS